MHPTQRRPHRIQCRPAGSTCMQVSIACYSLPRNRNSAARTSGEAAATGSQEVQKPCTRRMRQHPKVRPTKCHRAAGTRHMIRHRTARTLSCLQHSRAGHVVRGPTRGPKGGWAAGRLGGWAAGRLGGWAAGSYLPQLERTPRRVRSPCRCTRNGGGMHLWPACCLGLANSVPVT